MQLGSIWGHGSYVAPNWSADWLHREAIYFLDIDVGYWYARSAEFLQTGGMDTLRWMRVIGDTVFAFGAVTLVAFVAALATGHAYKRPGAVDDPLGIRGPRR